MDWETIKVHNQDTICFAQFNRPEASNTINKLMVEEFHELLKQCDENMNIIVLEGLPDVFCGGADFQGIHSRIKSGDKAPDDPERLYDLWLKMAAGPCLTISLVRGKANAGGLGFVAASDIVLAENSAQFSLSELLFGLFPACVLPFLIRKIGFQKAHYMTLMTKPIAADQACAWGLVDACSDNAGELLRKHLLRLKNITKPGISKYKKFMGEINDIIYKSKSIAVTANRELFSDANNLKTITKYVENGQMPWEN